MFLDDLKALYNHYCDFGEIDKVERPIYYVRVFPLLKNLPQPHADDAFRVFSAAVDIMNKNGFPQVVEKEDYAALDSPTYYHGASKIKHLACFLADFDYHKGEGWFDSGFYATKEIKYAKKYASYLRRNILKFKLSPDTKTISSKEMTAIETHIIRTVKKHEQDEISKECEKFCKTLDPEVQERLSTLIDFLTDVYEHGNQNFYDDIMQNSSTIAVLLGYDAYISDDSFPIIFNRGKIVVSEHEFNRITNATRLYRHGRINFEYKRDEDFIRE